MKHILGTLTFGTFVPQFILLLFLFISPHIGFASHKNNPTITFEAFPLPADTFYAELKHKPDGAFVFTQSGWLCFKYNERYASTASLDYTVYDDLHQVVSFTPTPTSIQKKYGMNWVRVYLPRNSPFSMNSIYILEVTNSKGEKLYLRFKYDF